MANKSNKRNTISEQARNRGLRLPGIDKTKDTTNELLTTISGNVSELIEYLKKEEQEEDVNKKKGVVKTAVKGSTSSSASKNDISTMLDNIQKGLYFVVSNFANKPIKPGDNIQSFVKAKGSQKSIADFISTIYYENHDTYKSILDSIKEKKDKSSNISQGTVDDIKDLVSDIKDFSEDTKGDINVIGQLITDSISDVLDEIRKAKESLPNPTTSKPIQTPDKLIDIVSTLEKDVSGIIINRLGSLESYSDNIKKDINTIGQLTIDGLSDIIGEIRTLKQSLPNLTSTKPTQDSVIHIVEFKDDDTKKVFSNLSSITFDPKNVNVKGVTAALSSLVDSLIKVTNEVKKINQKDFEHLEELIDPKKGSLYKICENLNKMNSNVGNTKFPMEALSSIINSIISLGDFDKTKYKNTKNFLKKLIVLTSTPSMIGRIADDGNGLLYRLIKNVNDMNGILNSSNSNKNINAINLFLKNILDIGAKDEAEEEVENLKDVLSSIGSLYEKNGGLPKLAEQINSYFGSKENKNMLKNSIAISSNITKIFESIEQATRDIKAKKIFEVNISIIALRGTFSLINGLAKYTEKINKKKLKELINIIQSIGLVFESISNTHNNVSFKGILKINMGLSILASTLQILNPISNLAEKVAKGGEKNSKIHYIVAFAKLLDKAFIETNNVVEHTPKAKDLLKMTFILGGIGGLGLATLLVSALTKNSTERIESINEFLVGIRDNVFKVLGKMSDTKYMKGATNAIKDMLSINKSLVKMALATIMAGVFSKTAMAVIPGMKEYIEGLVDLAQVIDSKVKVKKVESDIDKLEQLTDVVLNVALIGVYSTLVLPFIVTGIIGLKVMGLMVTSINSFVKSISKIKVNKKALKKLKAITSIIYKASAIILLGALVGTFAITALPAIIGFTAVLTIFMTGMSLVLGLITRLIGKKRIHSIEQFGLMIAACGAVMTLGAMFMYIPGLWQQALKFGVVLAAFVTCISLPYILMTKFGGRRAIKSAKELNWIVVISASVMMIGAMFMYIPGMALNALTFGLILGGFVVAICFAFRIAGKAVKAKTIAAMIVLTALVAISGTLLLTAGMMMLKYPGLTEGIFIFLGAMGLMIGGMAAILGLIALCIKSKIFGIKEIGGAFLVMVGIIGLVWLTSLVMDGIIEGVQKVGGKWQEMDKYIAHVEYIIGKFLILVGVFAAIICIGGIIGTALTGTKKGALVGAAAAIVLIGSAELMVAGIIKLIEMTGDAMISIANGMRAWKSVGKFDYDDVSKSIYGYIELVGIIGAAFGLGGIIAGPAMILATETILLASVCISTIANSIKDVCDLTIPIYDENGKVKGRRNLNKKDFETAADNVKAIITTLGGAIISLYKEDKLGIFNVGGLLANFLRVDTPFSRVCKSCMNLGEMISKISEGVKDMADLKIGIYEGTKLVGYRHLKKEDFDLAKDNVKAICETLGTAIIEIYDKHPDMFQDKSLLSYVIGESPSNTKFGIVIKSLTGISKLISSISGVVKDVVDLKIPIYSGTKVVGYHHLDNKDFINVGNNVNKIMTSMAQALFDTYDTHPDMFQDKSLIAWATGVQFSSNTKMARVINSFKGIGMVISQMAIGLQSILNLSIPVYGKDGKVTGRLKIDTNQLKKGGALYNNIKTIMLALPSALAEVYEEGDGKDWWSYTGSVQKMVGTNMFAKMAVALQNVGNIVLNQSKAVDEILKLKGVDDKETLVTKIKNIVSAIPDALSAVYDEGQKSDWWSNSGAVSSMFGTNKFGQIANTLKGIGDIVNEQMKSIETITNFLDKSKIKDLEELKKKINKILSFLPNAIHDLLYESENSTEMKASYKAIITDESIATSIASAYSSYSDAIYSMIKGFNGVNELMNKLNKGKKGDNSKLFDTVIDNMNKLIRSMTDINISEDTIQLLTGSFTTCAASYADGITKLKTAFIDFPVLNEEVTTGIKNAFSTINYSIDGVDDNSLEKFRSETSSLSDFVYAVNDVDIQKASSITQMMTSIKDMATKIGDLNAFTKTLANDLAEVLEHLTEQLKESAKSIDTAERIQKERHKQISKSIQTVNSLLNNPVNVIVKQEDIANTQSEPDNSGSGFNDSSASFSGGSGGGSQFNGGSGGENNGLANKFQSFLQREVAKLTGKDTPSTTNPKNAVVKKSGNNKNGNQ